MTRVGLGALALTIAAILAVASPAAAKGGSGSGGSGGGGGGGGGGGATCATIPSFSAVPGTSTGTGFTLDYSIDNGCVDEFMSQGAVDVRDDSTGFTTRAVTMLPYGLSTSHLEYHGTASTRYTVTLTVYAPNGKVQATITQQVTTPAA